MRMRGVYAVVAALVMVSGGAARAEEAKVGTPAPDFALADANGTRHRWADARKKFVVLEWFNHECPFVGKHYGSRNMQTLQAEATGKGVTWLTIASSAAGKQGYLTPDAAKTVIRERGAKQTALLLDSDGTVGRLYGAKTTPHVFVIDPEGIVIYAGAIDSQPSADPADIATATNYVRQALDEAMAGHPVTVPSTRPYGCSVKYRE